MTFPTIPTVANGRVVTSLFAATTAAKTFTGVLTTLAPANGDRVIAFVFQYGASQANIWSGWTTGFVEIADPGASGVASIGIAYKDCDGTESGNFTVTQAGTVGGQTALILIKIPAGEFDPATPPAVGGWAVGTNAAANPGSLSPGWEDDTLWIAAALCGETSTTGSFTGLASGPANYTDYVDTGITADVVGGVEGALAFRQLVALSEDPGTFSTDTSNSRWAGITVALKPAALSAPPSANAGTDQTVASGATVNLNGTGSTDDVSITSYSWIQTAGGGVSAPWVGTIDQGNVAGSNGTSATVDITGATVGQTVYAFAYLGDAQTATPTMTGWTLVNESAEGTTGGSSSRLCIFKRVKQSGDTTFSISWGVSCKWQIVPISWPGVTSEEGLTFLAHTTGTSYVTGTATPSAASRWAVGVFGSRGTTAMTAWTDDAALTDRANAINTSNIFLGLLVGDTNATASQASHTYTATGQTASHGIGAIMYLVPDIPLTGANTSTPSFTAPTVSVNTDYTFQLTVSDADGQQSTDTVVITVTPAGGGPTPFEGWGVPL